MSEWRAVVGFGGDYEVSDDGHVRSWKYGTPRLRHPSTDAWGYQRVDLYYGDGSKPRSCSVHELVLEAFVGPRPHGLLARHLDGDPKHNVPSNLAWGTVAENAADTVAMGRSLRGERSPVSRLTEAEVHAVRRAYMPGITRMEDFAATHGVTRLTIRNLLTGKSWGWLDTPGWAPIAGDMRTERHKVASVPRTATGKFKAAAYGLAGSGRGQ